MVQWRPRLQQSDRQHQNPYAIQWPETKTTPKPSPYAWEKAANIVYIDERPAAVLTDHQKEKTNGQPLIVT